MKLIIIILSLFSICISCNNRTPSSIRPETDSVSIPLVCEADRIMELLLNEFSTEVEENISDNISITLFIEDKDSCDVFLLKGGVICPDNVIGLDLDTFRFYYHTIDNVTYQIFNSIDSLNFCFQNSLTEGELSKFCLEFDTNSHYVEKVWRKIEF